MALNPNRLSQSHLSKSPTGLDQPQAGPNFMQTPTSHERILLERFQQLLEITDEDLAYLHRLKPLLQQHADHYSRRVYEKIVEIPELKHIIDEHTTVERLSKTMREWFLSLGNMVLDENYEGTRKRLGALHSNAGLKPHWYIGSFVYIYETLIPLLVARYRWKPQELSRTLLAINRILLLEQITVVNAYEEENGYKELDSASKALEFFVQYSDFSHVLENMEELSIVGVDVNAAVEELNASIEEVATNAADVAQESQEAANQAEKSKQVISQTLERFAEIGVLVQKSTEQLRQLNEKMGKMEKVVETIQGIAEQTNLLALNASIEAARAGEAGKGFAVVASEVRKLSEATQQSAGQIEETIHNLQKEVKSFTADSEEISQDVSRWTQEVSETHKHLDDILVAMENASSSLQQMAAITEEQTATTQSIAGRIEHMISIVDRTNQQTYDLARLEYEASVALNENRLAHAEKLKQTSALLRRVKTDHLLWKWWIYNHIFGIHPIEDPRIVSDVHHCKLGQFIDELADSKVRSQPAFSELVRVHHRVHKTAYSAIDQYAKDQREAAKETLKELEGHSKQIVQLLDQLAL